MTWSHPTLIDAADKLAADPTATVDSWWFTTKLHTDETVYWVKIHTMGMQGTCHSTVSLLQEPEGHSSTKQITESLDAVTLPGAPLDARTSILTISGDLDDLQISGATDTASVQLTLQREEPVLYNSGSGLFPLFGGMNGQYALPGLTTSGSITVDGTTHQIGGRTWFDRQWGTPPAASPRAPPGSASTRSGPVLEHLGHHRRRHLLAHRTQSGRHTPSPALTVPSRQAATGS
ncbi:lipocalin-like domain-containing protein [Streptomyces atroolivaceus]|uniref:Lipocalin-like domain-containing protein n=1 Tax=Streptomyces atroolivaceus TaxID=66869 RepID=A0ABV9VFR4_STRAZ|nr:lipocalin-like domain-containing protein [Streptomyces atroolivaceus]